MRFSNTRYIPQASTKVADKASDAVAYAYTSSRGRPAVVVYFGKQTKAVAHYSFRSEAERAATVARLFDGRRAAVAAKADYAASRVVSNKLEVGDILSTCWGYDQTNREFYEVTEASGRHVTIRQVATASESTGSMSGRCVPQSGEFIGPAMRKVVQFGDRVSINSHITATKWNTAKIAGVPVGPAVNWSSWA